VKWIAKIVAISAVTPASDRNLVRIATVDFGSLIELLGAAFSAPRRCKDVDAAYRHERNRLTKRDGLFRQPISSGNFVRLGGQRQRP
jgi:hypothetical protein